VIGECKSGKAVTRRGAKPGDIIYVSGSLGGSALGLSLLEQGVRLVDSKDKGDPVQKAVLKHLAPEPQLQLGRALAETGVATAMIDISDGLSTDLWHILDESGCGAVLQSAAIPIAESVRAIAPAEMDHLRLSLNGGEEYELLFTAQPENRQRAVEESAALGIRITEIGEIIEQRTLQLKREGLLEYVEPGGYEHTI
jgi:thiamine-monophosphate kinase